MYIGNYCKLLNIVAVVGRGAMSCVISSRCGKMPLISRRVESMSHWNAFSTIHQRLASEISPTPRRKMLRFLPETQSVTGGELQALHL